MSTFQGHSGRLADAYGPGKFGLSFELFPPKSEAGEQALWRNLDELVEFRPSFITCTYGAGGTTRLVMLPFESHGYQAIESIEHVVAEQIEWFDRYVKAAKPRAGAAKK